MDEERALVQQAIQGDSEAFGRLYRFFRPSILNYSTSRLASRDLAEDVTAETFLRAYLKIREYEDREVPFQAWLMKIAHNLIASYFRAKANHSSKRIHVYRFMGEYVYEDDLSSIEIQSSVDVDELLGCLSDTQRTVIKLRFLEGRSIKAVAKEMGKTEGNVKALQHKAMNKLRRRAFADERLVPIG